MSLSTYKQLLKGCIFLFSSALSWFPPLLFVPARVRTISLFSFLSASSSIFNALSISKSIHTRQGGRCLAGDSTDEEKGTLVSLLSILHAWCCNHVPYSPERSHSPWSAISPAWNRGTECPYGFWEMPGASIRE